MKTIQALLETQSKLSATVEKTLIKAPAVADHKTNVIQQQREAKTGSMSISRLSQAPESEMLVENKAALAALVTMICAANGETAPPEIELQLMRTAMDRFAVTVAEAERSYWQAYGDEYVGNGRIVFRHLMKHVRKEREEKAEGTKRYTWEMALNLMEEHSLELDHGRYFNLYRDEQGKAVYVWKPEFKHFQK